MGPRPLTSRMGVGSGATGPGATGSGAMEQERGTTRRFTGGRSQGGPPVREGVRAREAAGRKGKKTLIKEGGGGRAWAV